MTKSIAIAALCLACNSLSPPPAMAEGSAMPDVAASAMPSVEEPCGLVLSPEPGLSARTANAAVRWSKATGCDVSVGEGGVPVRLVDDLRTPAGKVAAGHTSRDDAGACSSIEIWLYYADATTVPHEIGHCLGATTHSATGLMSDAETGTGAIDEASLAVVCAAFPCLGFNPEH